LSSLKNIITFAETHSFALESLNGFLYHSPPFAQPIQMTNIERQTVSSLCQSPRAARKQELRRVAALATSIFRPNGGDMAKEYPALFHPDNRHNLFILTDAGPPVSLVAAARARLMICGAAIEAVGFGSVCTHPDYRSRGLAGALLDHAEAVFRRDGVDLVYVSGMRDLYRRKHYAPAGRFSRYELPVAALRKLAASDVDIQACRRDDLRDLSRIYQTKPVRFLREMRSFPRLFDGLLIRGQTVTMARRDGHALAYAAARVLPPNGRLDVQEYALARPLGCSPFWRPLRRLAGVSVWTSAPATTPCSPTSGGTATRERPVLCPTTR